MPTAPSVPVQAPGQQPRSNQKLQLILLLVFGIIISDMTWKKVLGTGVCMIGAGLAMLYFYQENLLYLPNVYPEYKKPKDNPSAEYRDPKGSGMDFENVYIRTRDKVKLHAWWVHAPKDPMKAPTFVFFHANAANMGFRLPNVEKINKILKANVFMVSYRGYGESQGAPTEEGLKIDADTTMEYVLKRKEVDSSRLFVFGRSLGGAFASYAARKYTERITALVLENTFTSIKDMVGTVFPLLNWGFIKEYLVRMHWRSIDQVPQVTVPILFISSDYDEIVPKEHMAELHKAAVDGKAAYTKFHTVAATHSDAWMGGITNEPEVQERLKAAYWKTFKEFTDKVLKMNQPEEKPTKSSSYSDLHQPANSDEEKQEL